MHYRLAFRSSTPFLTAFCVLGLCVLPAACSNGSEGDPCSTLGDNAGNDECTAPLICTAKSLLGGAAQVDRCCLPDLAQSTDPVCKGAGNAGLNNDAGPPPLLDASNGDAGTLPVDAPSDTANDRPAAVDASIDTMGATSDAAADGG